MNERLGLRRNDHLEAGARGNRCPVLIEDRPLVGPACVPDADVVLVGGGF